MVIFLETDHVNTIVHIKKIEGQDLGLLYYSSLT